MLLAACGGGGSSSAGPQSPASVPDGSGSLAIDMSGVWAIADAQILASNAANPLPPINGTPFVHDVDRIVSIGGISVSPESLTVLLDAPLLTYVNRLDGQTLHYSVLVDRRANGGTREEIVVAGGSLDPDTIAVEAYASAQRIADPEPVFVLSRYLLERVVPTPVVLDPPVVDHRSPFAPAVGAR